MRTYLSVDVKAIDLFLVSVRRELDKKGIIFNVIAILGAVESVLGNVTEDTSVRWVCYLDDTVVAFAGWGGSPRYGGSAWNEG